MTEVSINNSPYGRGFSAYWFNQTDVEEFFESVLEHSDRELTSAIVWEDSTKYEFSAEEYERLLDNNEIDTGFIRILGENADYSWRDMPENDINQIAIFQDRKSEKEIKEFYTIATGSIPPNNNLKDINHYREFIRD